MVDATSCMTAAESTRNKPAAAKVSGRTGRVAQGKARRSRAGAAHLDIQSGQPIRYARVYETSLREQAELAKQGLAATLVQQVAADMGMDTASLLRALGLPKSAVTRKVNTNKALNIGGSERLLGVMRLVGQVQRMVKQSGTPKGFDAGVWVGEWLERPLPALDGRKPTDYMDTAAGQALVSQLLGQVQSGAYG